MDHQRLRPRARNTITGFLEAEIERMEKLCKDSGENYLSLGVYRKLAISFNNSIGRAGKPRVKWTEVQSWFQDNRYPTSISTSPSTPPKKLSVAVLETSPFTESPKISQESKDVEAQKKLSGGVHETRPITEAPEISQESKDVEAQKKLSGVVPDTTSMTEVTEISQEFKDVVESDQKVPDLVVDQYEARSKKDGAWYDVYAVTKHRVLSPYETEVRIIFSGFGSNENEWVNVKEVRKRSIPIENSECEKVTVGDTVLCFWEKNDEEAKYYDARVMGIRRRVHDIRGCRCIFFIKYDHNNTGVERVALRNMCRRA